MILLEFPALAVLTNDYLITFNELRQCAIISIRPKLVKIIEESLRTIANELKALESTIHSKDSETFTKLCQTVTDTFIPYIDKCFSHIYQSSISLLDLSSIIFILSEIYTKRKASVANISLLSSSVATRPSAPSLTPVSSASAPTISNEPGSSELNKKY